MPTRSSSSARRPAIAGRGGSIPAQAGYSGTPLARKLGFRPGMRAVAIGAPDDYAALLDPLPDGVRIGKTAGKSTDLVHLFVTRQEVLQKELVRLRAKLGPEAAVWVSWPKKASKVPTSVTEDTIRSAALPLGFVDVKVCAVDPVWSGLKLVVRKALRPAKAT